jgi:glycosyltransferase involved in cell wall biosynthesis
LSDWASGRSQEVRACGKQAAIVIASNRETYSRLIKIGVPVERMRILSPVHFSRGKIESYLATKKNRELAGPIRFFGGGNLEGRKGVAIALHALALAKKRGLKFVYTLGGGGPEAMHLKRLADKLGLEREVIFHPGFRGQDYLDELKQTHVYLLPSLRENAGITLLEAMLAGCVPVVVDAGGPGEIVDNQCGLKCPLGSPESMAIWICQKLLHLAEAREEIEVMGAAGSRHVAANFSSDQWVEKMVQIYKKAIQSNVQESSLVKNK